MMPPLQQIRSQDPFHDCRISYDAVYMVAMDVGTIAAP
jgi:hypothetical protein